MSPWATSGGKTLSDFWKTHDEKFVLKEVKKNEFKMFINFGPGYFEYMGKILFENVPSIMAKILGAFVIKIKKPQIKKQYILILENLNLGIS